MIQMIFYRLILSFLLFFVAKNVYPQGGAVIKATVDKNRILIGEPMLLTVEAKLSPEATIDFVNIDSIRHFEFLESPHIDTASSDGSTTIKGVYKITSFDSGHWVIPSFVLSGSVKTDSIPVDVVFSDFDPNQNYHDIKDIIEVKPSEKKQWWWYVAAAGLLIALLLLYFLRKKKPVIQAIPSVIINPFDEAMKELEQLQQSKPDTKQYHSRLVDIFRLYVYRKKGVLSLQKTTDDLVLQLKDLELPKEQFDKLSQSLRLSDFVKFAKYVPAKDDDMTCFNEIRNAIITIEKSGGEVLPTGRIKEG